MKPSISDIIVVNQILSLWGHLVDKRAWDRFGEVFTEDACFDSSVFGFAPVTGIEAIRHMASREGHARAHHTTNLYVHEGPNDEIGRSRKVLACCRTAR
ncbi:nuclear transport factor 2 family protein [Mesorhizobium newzealandense]|uniref:Nuclear transport factor 2 family protein n=1 Tax=Mesorhizobium newzealandense TaxID=1300302 RepID=A0ABW4U3P4_9HYPH